MSVPPRGLGRAGDFFRRLADAPSRVLLLDYDGTLAPFREERDRAVPYPGVREAVAALAGDGRSRVVVVSGRAVADVQRLLGLDPPPELWGSHGWERRAPGGEVELEALPPDAAVALAGGRTAVERAVDAERVERKPVSVAVHTRGLDPRAAGALEARVRDLWREAAAVDGMEVHAFDGGVELRVGGRDKGTAVERILADEADDALVAYLGDDLTDEDAFRALEPLGARALRALVRPEPRHSAADLWIRPPDELLELLERWRETVRSSPGSPR